MIYKELGNVKIHRLRVIHLYKADMGLLWGAKWGKSMKTTVQENTLHPGQYGGLPGRDCTSVTFFKELRYEYARLTRYPFSNFYNDATACYDRILLSIASLFGLKFGLHQDIVFIHETTLEEAEFKLKTIKKVSKTSYKHCLNFPFTEVAKDLLIVRYYGHSSALLLSKHTTNGLQELFIINLQMK